MEAHKPDLGIQILGLFNPKQGRKYRTYQFDLLITDDIHKISPKFYISFQEAVIIHSKITDSMC